MAHLVNALYHLSANTYDSGVDKECEEYPPADQSQPFRGRMLEAALDLLNVSSAEVSESQGFVSARRNMPPYHTDAMNITLAAKNSTFLR